MSEEGIRETLQRWFFLFLNCIFRNPWIFEETPPPLSVLSRKRQITLFFLRNGLPNLSVSSNGFYAFPLPTRWQIARAHMPGWMVLPFASGMIKHSNHWKLLCNLMENLQSEFGVKILQELAETKDKNVKAEILIAMNMYANTFSKRRIESLVKARWFYRPTARVSRRTIDRAIKKLVHLDLLEYVEHPRRSGNGYRLTDSGNRIGSTLEHTLQAWSDSQTAWFLALDSEVKKLRACRRTREGGI